MVPSRARIKQDRLASSFAATAPWQMYPGWPVGISWEFEIVIDLSIDCENWAKRYWVCHADLVVVGALWRATSFRVSDSCQCSVSAAQILFGDGGGSVAKRG